MIGYGNGTPCVCGEKNTWHKKCYQNQADEITQLRARVAELTKQRDDLLAALSELTSTVGLAIDGATGWDEHKNARKLIASVKGQP
jgi:hypothetical protein